MVETDTTINNTGEYIMGETDENTVSVSNSNKRSMTLVDTEDNSASKDYFPPLKIFQTCSLQSHTNRVFRRICCLIFQSCSIVLFQMLNLRTSSYNITSFKVMYHLDEFLRVVVQENHKYSQIQEDKLLQKMQQKLLNVLVPLSKIWQEIEDSTPCKTDRVEIDLREFKELAEQSIMMFGQLFNNITYNRRLSVLNALMKAHKSKQMSKEKASIFSESHKELFGQNVRENWFTNLKTKPKYQEILRKETKLTPTTISMNGPLFRGGPRALSSGRGGGGRALQAFFVRTMPQTQSQHGKSNKITLPQHSTTSACRQVKSTSFGQKPFPCLSETGSY